LLTQIVVDTILGVIARAQARYGVAVIDVKQMSSHLHLLCFFEDGQQMARFMRYVNSNLARKVGRLVGWRGPFWERRYSHVVVTEEEKAQVERLRYSLENGCKEGLVWKPQDWPGVTGVKAMLSGSMKLVGSWLDLSGLYEARQRGESTATRRFVEKHTLTLSKLPCWEHLDDDDYKKHVQGLVDSIAQETAAMHASARSEPLGVKELRKLRPNQRTAHPDHSPKPLVHAASRDRRRQFREGWRLFVELYLAASERLRNGFRDTTFPPGSFPPRMPFVPLRAGPSG
jgi:REP element-mobilizing transposase RayT